MFIEYAHNYARRNYGKLNGTIIYNSLHRYVNQYSEIMTKEKLIESIENGVIRGIGKKSTSIIKEYIESTK